LRNVLEYFFVGPVCASVMSVFNTDLPNFAYNVCIQ
jgi:hypothetical protein